MRNSDGTETQVYTAHALNLNRLKFTNGQDVPQGANTYQKGYGQHFVRNPDGTATQVYTANALSKSRLKFANGLEVHPDADTYQKGRQHFVRNSDGTETQVYTAAALSNSRLKFANGLDVPQDADTYQNGRQHFVRNPDGTETQVYTAAALSNSRFKFANGQDVPQDANAYQKGRKHFVRNSDGTETQVYTANVLSKSRLKFANGLDIPQDAYTYQKGYGHHFMRNPDGTEIQVYTANALSMRRRFHEQKNKNLTNDRPVTHHELPYQINSDPNQHVINLGEYSNSSEYMLFGTIANQPIASNQIQNVPISSPSIMNNLYQSAEEGHSSGPPTIVNTVEDRFNQLTYLSGDQASLIKTIENYKSLGVVNDANTKGETLAILAAQQNRPDIISALSLYGEADLNQSDSNHLSPLLAAAQRGHKETVQVLCKFYRIDLDKKDINGNTVIDLAYMSGHQDLGNWLVKYQQKHFGAPANLVSMSTSQNSGQSSHAIIAQRLNQTGRQYTENCDEQHNIPSDFSPSQDIPSAAFWANRQPNSMSVGNNNIWSDDADFCGNLGESDELLNQSLETEDRSRVVPK